MNLFKRLKTYIPLVLAALSVQTAASQDLLARQAPIDRKMKAVDSVVLQRILQSEEYEMPAFSLYEDWDNQYAHRATAMPDSFLIDLRDFTMPTPSRVVTSNFGSRWGRQHKGLDVKVYIGDTIRAAFSGKVRIVNYEAKGYGNYVVIRHPNGLETIYGHMSKHLVRENQEVRSGDPIGLGGNTGRSTGSHLHFETRLCGVALNPALMFDFANQDVVGDSYFYNKRTYNREAAEATRLRGANGKYGYNPDDVNSDRATASASSFNSGSRFHKVKRGETLSAIARKRHTTIDALCRANRIGKSVKLMPGQILKY